MAAAAAAASSSAASSAAAKSFAAAHYPFEILECSVSLLTAPRVYAKLLREIVTSSNASDISLLVQRPGGASSGSKGGKSGGGDAEDTSDTASTKSTSSSSAPLIESFVEFFAPSLTWNVQHVPHGQMKRASLFCYLTPHGLKTISAEGVAATLSDAKMPYVTDLIRVACNNDEDAETAAFETLRQMDYSELDVARFCLCALWDLLEKGAFNKEGELTPLAKRDLKKALATAAAAAASGGGGGGKAGAGGAAVAVAAAAPAAAGSKAAQQGGGAGAAAAAASSGAVVGTGTSAGATVQKQLRALLEEEAAAAFPHTPVSKSVVFTMEQDPNQPRHKPLFRATVELALLKKTKVEGDWCGTKRDADNSAADKALPLMRRMLAKK